MVISIVNNLIGESLVPSVHVPAHLCSDPHDQVPFVHQCPKPPSLFACTTSDNIAALLACIQSADPSAPDINKDNACHSWGHNQFTTGNLNLKSCLTSWQEVGSIDIAFELVAAALKTCQEAHMMCMKAGVPKMNGFISDAFLKMLLKHLEKCWVDAGGVCDYFFSFHFC
jgi:hypothetical protein